MGTNSFKSKEDHVANKEARKFQRFEGEEGRKALADILSGKVLQEKIDECRKINPKVVELERVGDFGIYTPEMVIKKILSISKKYGYEDNLNFTSAKIDRFGNVVEITAKGESKDGEMYAEIFFHRDCSYGKSGSDETSIMVSPYFTSDDFPDVAESINREEIK